MDGMVSGETSLLVFKRISPGTYSGDFVVGAFDDVGEVAEVQETTKRRKNDTDRDINFGSCSRKAGTGEFILANNLASARRKKILKIHVVVLTGRAR